MLSDFRFAARTLARSPGFTLAALAALGLGIGVNTAAFSGVNSLLFRPAGIADPEYVVAARVHYHKLNLRSISLSLTDFDDIRKAKHLFQSAALMTGGDSLLSGYRFGGPR